MRSPTEIKPDSVHDRPRYPRGRGLRHDESGVRSPMSIPRWLPSSGAAGGTVRWGLRAGHAAWPDRSAPAPAVGELAFDDGMGNSSPGVGGFGVAILPRLRCLGHSDRILLGLLLRRDGLEIWGVSALPGCPDRIGRADFQGRGESRSDLHHRGHGTPPRASRVEPGQHRGVPNLIGSAAIPSPILPAAGRRSLPAARPADSAGRPERGIPSFSSSTPAAGSPAEADGDDESTLMS
jgi:hypothetical protein